MFQGDLAATIESSALSISSGEKLVLPCGYNPCYGRGRDRSMNKLEIPTKCPKCSLDFYVDFSVFTQSFGRRVRLWCRSGHSIFVTLIPDSEVGSTPEREKVLQRELAPITLHKEHSRNRSVLCSTCRQRIYNAFPNQKHHSGSCVTKAKAKYQATYGRKQKLRKAG